MILATPILVGAILLLGLKRAFFYGTPFLQWRLANQIVMLAWVGRS
jgi:hypothetical protein